MICWVDFEDDVVEGAVRQSREDHVRYQLRAPKEPNILGIDLGILAIRAGQGQEEPNGEL